MLDILIKDAIIVTMDKNNRIFHKGFVGIKGHNISLVTDDLEQGIQAKTVINGDRKLVMPGLINCHTHIGMTALRGYADDMPLWDWLTTKIWPLEERLTADDIYWVSMLAIMEMIKSGITTFSDMYFFMEQTALAVKNTGIRAVLARGLQGIDENSNQRLKENKELYTRWHNSCDERIKVMAGPHAIYTCSGEFLIQVLHMVNEMEMGIHIHLSETKKEVENCMAQHGKSPVKYLFDMGLLDKKHHVVAAHCVHLLDSDFEILKCNGVSIVNNPTSNCKLGNGFAQVSRMLDMGLNVSLGTDSAASNNNLNMFEEMHLAALMNKGITCDPTCVTALDTLRMATVNGAKALNWENKIGSIEVEKRADMIILDLDKPHFYPMHQIVSGLVYSAQASDVETVIINGEMVMHKREFNGIDEQRVYNKIKRMKPYYS